MARLTVGDVRQKFLAYVDFKTKVMSMPVEDKWALQGHLRKLYRDWRDAAWEFSNSSGSSNISRKH